MFKLFKKDKKTETMSKELIEIKEIIREQNQAIRDLEESIIELQRICIKGQEA